VEEGVRELDDKSHAPKHPRRKVTLESMNEIRKSQENPELGEWRVHAALKDIGIKLSPRTCGRILALNRSLYGLKGPKKEPNAPKEMPFKASRRHEIWTVDIGKHWEPSQLDRIFYSTRFQRRLNKHGTTLDSDIGDSMASWG